MAPVHGCFPRNQLGEARKVLGDSVGGKCEITHVDKECVYMAHGSYIKEGYTAPATFLMCSEPAVAHQTFKSLRKFRNDSLLDVYDVCIMDGKAFLVTERVDCTLRQYCKANAVNWDGAHLTKDYRLLVKSLLDLYLNSFRAKPDYCFTDLESDQLLVVKGKIKAAWIAESDQKFANNAKLKQLLNELTARVDKMVTKELVHFLACVKVITGNSAAKVVYHPLLLNEKEKFNLLPIQHTRGRYPPYVGMKNFKNVINKSCENNKVGDKNWTAKINLLPDSFRNVFYGGTLNTTKKQKYFEDPWFQLCFARDVRQHVNDDNNRIGRAYTQEEVLRYLYWILPSHMLLLYDELQLSDMKFD